MSTYFLSIKTSVRASGGSKDNEATRRFVFWGLLYATYDANMLLQTCTEAGGVGDCGCGVGCSVGKWHIVTPQGWSWGLRLECVATSARYKTMTLAPAVRYNLLANCSGQYHHWGFLLIRPVKQRSCSRTVERAVRLQPQPRRTLNTTCIRVNGNGNVL